MARARPALAMAMAAAAEALLLLLCTAAFVERGAALHLCTDRLFNDTQGRHDDGLPHLTPTEEATWMALLPRRLRGGGGARAEFDWLALYRSLTRGGGPDDDAGKPGPGELLSPASLHDVRLHGDDDHLPAGSSSSMYWQAQQTNLEYLLYLDPDRLTWTFRQQAGLPTVGDPYGGWEAPGGQLRGHFAGHYLSASAHMWAATHNSTLRERMARVVDILYDCQKKMGTGYLSAYPETMFDLYEQLDEAWSPYYTTHKIMQGLLDQYMLASNKKGLDVVVWMTDYFSNRVKNLIQNYTIQRHWEAMNEETGGFNDVMYQLYTITCGRIAGFNCKNGIDLEQVTWPEMGVHGTRQLMQLQQQFWHGDLAHPHQVASQWEKRGDGHPPVFSNSSPSLFGYDLTSSGAQQTPASKLKTEL